MTPLKNFAIAIAAAGFIAFWSALLQAGTTTSASTPWSHSSIGHSDFFPLAVWLQDPRNAAKYQGVGINLYIGLWQGPTQGQLDALSRAGMPVICAQNDVGLKNLDNAIIAGWMHGDEPDNAQARHDGLDYDAPVAPEKIVAEYEQMRKADPTRPVMLNLGQGVAWDGWYGRGSRSHHPEDYPQYVKGCDIASFDIYPVTHNRAEVAGHLEFVSHGVDRLIDWTDHAKPIWACIETTHLGNPNALPTPAQVRCEVWLALIHGARGIIYFSHEFKPRFIEAGLFAHPEIAAEVKQINAQITTLAPILNSPTQADVAQAESSEKDSPISAMCKLDGSTRYIFAAIQNDHAITGSFQIKGLTGHTTAEVIGEDRTIDINDGRFTDRFDSYAVHLYRIK